MLNKLVVAAAAILVLSGVALAAGRPEQFQSEDAALRFCKQGNVVWFNPTSKIYFENGSRFYARTKMGGYACRTIAERHGYRADKACSHRKAWHAKDFGLRPDPPRRLLSAFI